MGQIFSLTEMSSKLGGEGIVRMAMSTCAQALFSVASIIRPESDVQGQGCPWGMGGNRPGHQGKSTV